MPSLSPSTDHVSNSDFKLTHVNPIGSYCDFVAFGANSSDAIDPSYPDPSNETGSYKGALQCGVYTPTNVISSSWGNAEYDLPAAYQYRQCYEFMKLGLQGVTFVTASGDTGVAYDDGPDPPNGCIGANFTVFSPQFPGNCPYITTVGSTILPPGADVNTGGEISTTYIDSSGGFSNIYPRPEWQDAAVKKFFATANPPYPYYSTFDNDNPGANGGLYNRIGRAYPDISAIGDNVPGFVDLEYAPFGGTSFASPLIGAIITRINEERIAVGKSTVGFINPVLYANPWAFNDITNGTNPGCGTDGFTAVEGWDPVSGLGTPNYPDLLK